MTVELTISENEGVSYRILGYFIQPEKEIVSSVFKFLDTNGPILMVHGITALARESLLRQHLSPLGYTTAPRVATSKIMLYISRAGHRVSIK